MKKRNILKGSEIFQMFKEEKNFYDIVIESFYLEEEMTRAAKIIVIYSWIVICHLKFPTLFEKNEEYHKEDVGFMYHRWNISVSTRG